MFNFDFNMGNTFKGMFGKIDKGLCALSMSGGIAIKTSNGYKTYNMAKKRLTNVTNFCMEASDMFFVLPTSKVQPGDVILDHGKPKCVLRVCDEDRSIKCIDYETSEIREIVAERHVFLGSAFWYGKIVSLFGYAGFKGKGLMGKMIQLMIMKSMMGGNGNGNGGDMFGGMGQMLMMQQMFGGGAGNGLDFTNMFNLDFDTDATWNTIENDDAEPDAETGEEEEDETPKKPAKKTKKVTK
jgi:hypothetical protein